jgi:hypothetical protein
MVAILEIFQLIALLYNYLLPLIIGLIGVLSFFFYVKSKKKGFVVLGIAFIIQATYLAFYNTEQVIFLICKPTIFCVLTSLVSTVSHLP